MRVGWASKPLSTLNIIHHVLRVSVYPLNHLTLFRHHTSELSEDTAKLTYGTLNRFNGLPPGVDVVVRRLRLFHHEQLLVGLGATRAKRGRRWIEIEIE